MILFLKGKIGIVEKGGPQVALHKRQLRKEREIQKG